MILPRMYQVKQHFTGDAAKDIPAQISRALNAANMKDILQPGQRIAVAVGSRGIANIGLIVKTVVAELKESGVHPFIVPAMGSHGGATAAGQQEVLRSLGVSCETVGAPVVSAMEVIEAGLIDGVMPVYLDKHAAEADGIFLVNRIKPHTDFDAPIESGLVKMAAIGLGNHQGCSAIHAHGLAAMIPKAAQVLIEKGFIKGGLAIVENNRDETAYLECISGPSLLDREPQLLAKAKQLMARLPFDDIDVLVVKIMGKAISGTGMDTNVIGRLKVEGLPEPDGVAIKRIVALDLSADSYGNALGIGLADLTTRRLVDKINFKSMYANVISTSYLERGKIPVCLDTDREAVEAALRTIGPTAPAKAKVCVIRNTAELEELFVSETMLAAVGDRGDLEIVREVGELPFSDTGELLLFNVGGGLA